MTTTHSESLHPRIADGTFTEQTFSKPQATVKPRTNAELTAAIGDRLRESYPNATSATFGWDIKSDESEPQLLAIFDQNGIVVSFDEDGILDSDESASIEVNDLASGIKPRYVTSSAHWARSDSYEYTLTLE